MNYNYLQNQIDQDQSGLLEKVAEAAAQRAVAKISEEQLAQQAEGEAVDSESAIIKEHISVLGQAAALMALLEVGAIDIETPEDEEAIQEVLAQAAEIEDSIVNLIHSGLNASEDLEGALMSLGSLDPVTASAISSEAEGEDISPDQVDQMTDALADQMIAEETAGGNPQEEAKVAHARGYWEEWAKTSSPISQELYYNLALNKANAALQQAALQAEYE